jgi:hypothetical protein
MSGVREGEREREMWHNNNNASMALGPERYCRSVVDCG